jgi:hypothetical protein
MNHAIENIKKREENKRKLMINHRVEWEKLFKDSPVCVQYSESKSSHIESIADCNRSTIASFSLDFRERREKNS